MGKYFILKFCTSSANFAYCSMNINQKTASKIKELRNQANLSQKVIAEELGIKESTYGRIENGYTELTVTNLFRIAELLDADVGELLGLRASTRINNDKNAMIISNIQNGTVHIHLTGEELREMLKQAEKG